MGEAFDVFLCHNSSDKPAVRELADALALRGLRVWLDERELIPGRPWQDGLEAAIRGSRSVAVLVGSDGRGPWQQVEIRAALAMGAERGLPVIPVLLPAAPAEPELPLFLQAYTWVDFRDGFAAEGLDRLEWGIRGKKRKTTGIESAPTAVPAPSPPAAPAPPRPRRAFWQKHKENLERWALLLGVVALALGVLGDLLDLPAKWKALWNSPSEETKIDPAPPVQSKQLLRGRLRDEDTGAPLHGVRVWLPEPRLETTTDSDGQFLFELEVAEEARVKLQASLRGYQDLNQDPTVGSFLNEWKMRRAP